MTEGSEILPGAYGSATRCSTPSARIADLACLPLVAVLLVGLCGCASPRAVMVSNPLSLQAADRDGVWERAVAVLHQNHFEVGRESKLEGVIETTWRAGSSVFEPWHPDSVGTHSRVESTLQSIRRRVTVNMQSSSPGQMLVNVRVDKEIEDLPGIAATTEGGATLSESRILDRDLRPLIGQSSPSRWLPAGRDVLLESKLLSELQGRR